MTFLATLLALAVAGGSGAWDRQSPDRNADRVARLFRDVCVDHLGHSAEMAVAVEGAGAGFRSVYPGTETYGPVWDSPHGRISATDHRHNHDGDECQIDLRRSIAPRTQAMIAALRRVKLIGGPGEPAEFGATTFRRGDTMIFVRYDIPQVSTGVRKNDAGLMLLIQRPAG